MGGVGGGGGGGGVMPNIRTSISPGVPLPRQGGALLKGGHDIGFVGVGINGAAGLPHPRCG